MFKECNLAKYLKVYVYLVYAYYKIADVRMYVKGVLIRAQLNFNKCV